MSDTISMDEIARSWGARDWADAQRLVNAGYAFCFSLERGCAVLATRTSPMTVVGTVDEVRQRLDQEKQLMATDYDDHVLRRKKPQPNPKPRAG